MSNPPADTPVRARGNWAWYALAQQVPEDTRGYAYVDNMPLEGKRIVSMVIFYAPAAEYLEFKSKEEYEQWLVQKGYRDA